MSDPLELPLSEPTQALDPASPPVGSAQAMQREQESGTLDKVADTLEVGGLLVDAAGVAVQAGGLALEAGAATLKIAGAGVEIVGDVVGGIFGALDGL